MLMVSVVARKMIVAGLKFVSTLKAFCLRLSRYVLVNKFLVFQCILRLVELCSICPFTFASWHFK